MTGPKANHLHGEDPLSRQLEDFFVRNIIPAVATRAVSEARTAAEAFIGDARREVAVLTEAVRDQLAELERQAAEGREQLRILAELAQSLRAEFDRRQSTAKAQLDRLETETLGTLGNLVRKTDAALEDLATRRDELNDAATRLHALHAQISARNGDLADQAAELARGANAVALAARSREMERDAAGGPGGKPTQEPESGNDEAAAHAVIEKVRDKEVRSKRPPLLEVLKRRWQLAVLSLGIAALVGALLLYSPPGPTPSSTNAGAGPDFVPVPPAANASEEGDLKVEQAWGRLIREDPKIGELCKQHRCESFASVWDSGESGPEAAKWQAMVYQASVNRFILMNGCPKGSSPVKVDGDMGPTTMDLAARIWKGCLASNENAGRPPPPGRDFVRDILRSLAAAGR